MLRLPPHQKRIMAITRLKRKVRKNHTRATQRKNNIKRLLATPAITNIDVKQLQEAPNQVAPAM